MLELLPWEDRKDNSTVTDVAPREIPPIKIVVQDLTIAADKNKNARLTEIPVPQTESQAKELPTVAVPFAEKTNKRRINPLYYIGAGVLVLFVAGIIGITALVIFKTLLQIKLQIQRRFQSLTKSRWRLLPMIQSLLSARLTAIRTQV